MERLEYVKELMKYIKVDSYGHCLNNMKHTANRCVFYRGDCVSVLCPMFTRAVSNTDGVMAVSRRIRSI